MEIWKDLNGYEGLYKISSYGNILNVKRNTIKINGYDRYVLNVLSKNNKKVTVKLHRLVAQHFVVNPNPSEYNIVCHKDHNTYNNKSDNLYWGTQKMNLQQSSLEGRYKKK